MIIYFPYKQPQKCLIIFSIRKMKHFIAELILFLLKLNFEKVDTITELCRRKHYCFCQHDNTVVTCRNISLAGVNASTLPPATKELTIRDSYGQFTDAALDGLQTSLVRLFILRSHLEAVPVGLLSSLPNLVQLDLRDNDIMQIPQIGRASCRERV